MDSSKVLPKGRLLKGTYTIEKVLGAGGFGITYLARRMTGNITQWLAVKEFFISSICSRSGDDVWVSNVNREQYEIGKEAFISQARRIYGNSILFPNIVGVNEVFEQNDTAYYVMELVRGCTLAEYVGERGNLDLDSAMNLFEPVMQAVNLLHSMRILHLDIKPENVIVGRDNITDQLRPVLIDFDLSKHYGEDGEVTSAIQFISCSEGYAPKEQYELMGLSHFLPQADVYALGATLLFMLSGKGPAISSAFNREEIADMLGPSIPQNVKDAIYSAMAPEASGRTPSVVQFAIDLGLDPQDWPVANSSAEVFVPQASKKKSMPWRFIAAAACLCTVVLCVALLFAKGGGGLKPYTVKVGDFEIKMMPVVCGSDTFYMADKEVTQGLWNRLMGHREFKFERGNLPAMSLSPDECESFISALNATTGMKFRMPTSAEWQYAYRGGETMEHRFPGSDDPADVSWLPEKKKNPQKPGRKKPNAIGLYDMLGNMAELTKDHREISFLRNTNIKKDKYYVCGYSWQTTDPDSVQPCIPYSIIADNKALRQGVGLRLAADSPK
ncbi:MAG: bifunctional serine/threonine-protein kinase/formylglycine-generating enzyme family protein [Clostridium sp.]|nr:bifunctional serine/threonine-protein kinase/formylglycine-generating enzyme family protein [Clostridium sp.]